MMCPMLLRVSKVLRCNRQSHSIQISSDPHNLMRRAVPEIRLPADSAFGLVPYNQYEVPVSRKLKLRYALFRHWEIIPLFLVTVFDIAFVLCGSIISALGNKVDLQWTKHDWNCISRNMDMLNPTIHKLVTINQKYEPWPEMQIVFDKMTAAHHRWLTRQKSCDYP